MKLKNYLLSVLAVAGLTAFVSCDSKDEEDLGAMELTLSEESIEFETYAEDSKTIEIKATRDWKAEVSDNAKSWLSVSPAEGKASSKKQTVKVEVLANKDKDHYGTVTFTIYTGTASLGSKTLAVSQPGEKGSSYITIAELRAIRDASAEEKVTIPEGTAIKGTVISNISFNNLSSKKTIYVQDETAGVMIFLTEESSFAFGDKVSVDLGNMEYALYGEAHQINNVPKANVNKMGTETVEAKAVSEADFMANKYEGQYISLEKVQVVSSDLSKNWYNGSASMGNINMQFPSGAGFVVRTSKYASIKDQQAAQGAGPVKGIAQYYNGTLQLSFTNAEDFAGLTGERFRLVATEGTIADVIAAEAGVFKVKGAVVAMAGKGFVINDGGDQNLYVYYDKASIEADVAVGKVVSVEGTRDVYGKVVELKEPVATVISEVITPKEQEPVFLAPGEIDAYTCNYSALLSIEGEYKKDGSYHNMDLGATHKGSLVDCEVANSMVTGSRYLVTGYYTGSTNTYFNLLPIKVEAGSSKVLGVSTQEINVAASATSANFSVTGNCTWTAVSDNAAFAVSPASGNGAGEVTVSFSANESTEAARVANITVSTTEEATVKSFTVVITQAKKSSSGGENIELTFPDDNKADNKVGSYKSEWTAKIGSYSWKIVNFNNNNWNNNWAWIKTGWKTEALTASITTEQAISFPISQVSVVYDSFGSVNSHKLVVSSDAEGTQNVQEIPSEASAAGTVEYKVASPAANMYYKLVIDCQKTSSNGTVVISKITYVAQ